MRNGSTPSPQNGWMPISNSLSVVIRKIEARELRWSPSMSSSSGTPSANTGSRLRDAPAGAQQRNAGGPLVAQAEAEDAFVAILDAADDRAHAETHAKLRFGARRVNLQQMTWLRVDAPVDCIEQSVERAVERHGPAVHTARAHTGGAAGQQCDCRERLSGADAQQSRQGEMHGTVAAIDRQSVRCRPATVLRSRTVDRRAKR